MDQRNGLVGAASITLASNTPSHRQPNPKQMTIKVLDALAQDPDPDGFLLMAEGGHDHDAVDCIYQRVKQRDDTLLLVGADHATGSFESCYSRSDLPQEVMLPGDAGVGPLIRAHPHHRAVVLNTPAVFDPCALRRYAHHRQCK